MPRRKKHLQIHIDAQIGKIVREGKTPLNSKSWQKNHWYKLLQRRKYNGKNFGGHGNWYAYLEKKQGVSPPAQGIPAGSKSS